VYLLVTLLASLQMEFLRSGWIVDRLRVHFGESCLVGLRKYLIAAKAYGDYFYVVSLT
jgi:hypothetical protein